MTSLYEEIIRKAYAAFNKRDIDAALLTMHPAIQWPKAFEGGYVNGQAAVREYWTRQWTEINPTVEPIDVSEWQEDKVVVTVHQRVKDLQGKLLFDGTVKHVYTVKEGMLLRMDIEGDKG